MNSPPFYQTTDLGFQIKTKGRTTEEVYPSAARSSFSQKPLPLSFPPSRKVWLYLDQFCRDVSPCGRPLKNIWKSDKNAELTFEWEIELTNEMP
jgi:hypothetical protein